MTRSPGPPCSSLFSTGTAARVAATAKYLAVAVLTVLAVALRPPQARAATTVSPPL